MLWAPIFLRTGWFQCRPQPLHEVTRRIAIILLLLSYAKPGDSCSNMSSQSSHAGPEFKPCSLEIILKSSWPPAQALKSSVMLQEFHRFRALPLRIKDANPWGTEDLQITATCSLCGVVNPGVGRLSPSWCWRSGALYKQRFGFRPQCLGPWECFLSRPKNIKWEFAGISKIVEILNVSKCHWALFLTGCEQNGRSLLCFFLYKTMEGSPSESIQSRNFLIAHGEV